MEVISNQDRTIKIPNKVNCYVLSHVSGSKDQIQALNLIKTFNYALLQSDTVSLKFGITYEAIQPSYCIDFYTEDREIPFACLRTVLDHQQVQEIEVCPEDIYGPGSVRLYVIKLDNNNNKKRKRQEKEENKEWKLQAMKLDTIPEMGAWASETDRRIARKVLEFTYGMHSVMPILSCTILHKPYAEHYVIHCGNVPTIPYPFLRTMAAQFPTYVKQITLNVHRRTLCYTMRLNESPLTSLSLVPSMRDLLCSSITVPNLKRSRLEEVEE